MYEHEIETEVEQDEDELLRREAFAQGFTEVPDCEAAVGTPGNGVDYPANYDLEPCVNKAQGYYGAAGWLCDDHAEEAGVR